MARQQTTIYLHKPKAKGLYAWNSIHAGSFLLYVESLKDCHKFVFLPGPTDYYVTNGDFNDCINSGILEFVESLPDDIFQETISFSLKSPQGIVKLYSHKV